MQNNAQSSASFGNINYGAAMSLAGHASVTFYSGATRTSLAKRLLELAQMGVGVDDDQLDIGHITENLDVTRVDLL